MKAVPGILPTLLEMIYFFSTPTIDVEPKQTRPGEGSAIASLVLGIISCLTILVYAFSGRLSLGAIAVILGFVGIGAGNAAKNSGYRGGLRIAGTVVSWVGAVFGAIVCGKLLFVTML